MGKFVSAGGGRELVILNAEAARAVGYPAPACSIIAYQREAEATLLNGYVLLCIEEWYAQERAVKKEARVLQWAISNALSDMGRTMRASSKERVGQAASAMPELLELASDGKGMCDWVYWLAVKIRFEAALVGERGPYYRRAPRMIQSMSRLEEASRAYAARVRVGIAGDVYGDTVRTLSGIQKEGEEEKEGEVVSFDDPRALRAPGRRVRGRRTRESGSAEARAREARERGGAGGSGWDD